MSDSSYYVSLTMSEVDVCIQASQSGETGLTGFSSDICSSFDSITCDIVMLV